MERCHVEDEEDISSGDNMNVPVDNNVTCHGQDENLSEDKHQHEVYENASASGDDAMESNKNYAVHGLFTKLPPLVRAVLMSQPFWSGLVAILVWITCRHFNKRSPALLTRGWPGGENMGLRSVLLL
ncbi:TIR-NBS-LRR RCT1 resistance protein, partial [Trifolium medium]|nr:TIR-NBS-LRR RCT1 resistance protein [Trifolium medium]